MKGYYLYVNGHYQLKNDTTRKNSNWNAQQKKHNVIIILSASKRQAFGLAWEGLPWLYKSEWEDTLLHWGWHHSQDWNPGVSSCKLIEHKHLSHSVFCVNMNETHHLLLRWQMDYSISLWAKINALTQRLLSLGHFNIAIGNITKA